MLEKIQNILSQYTQEIITEDSALISDLGLSSFDIVSIVADFEDIFEIEIADRDIRKLIRVSDIVEYMSDKKQGDYL